MSNNKVCGSATTNLVSKIQFSNGRTIQYWYDGEERITRVLDSYEGETLYTYDALGQLTSETKNSCPECSDCGTTVNITYDNYGNITSKNGVSYTYGNVLWHDRLTGYGGKTISYDAQGNPTSYLGHNLTWEKGRQLKSFDNIQYTYNASGIRTSKTVDGIRHDYVVDGGRILKETWNDNVLIPIYNNEQEVVGIYYNCEPYYFYKNLQGDVIGISDNDGRAVVTYSYDAWGVCAVLFDNSGIGLADINPYRYRSYYYDTEIGMYYLQSRYYDPIVGRFVNADYAYVVSMFPSDNINLYSYCGNNPIQDLDIDGFASANSKNKHVNKFIENVQKYIINIYSDDFAYKEHLLYKIGTENFGLKLRIGASVQTNKNALFGLLFKKGVLEVSGFLGISNRVSFGHSIGISLSKVYFKTGILFAFPGTVASGFCYAISLELSLPTWLLATVAVATAVVSVYCPAVAAFLAKIFSVIRSSAKAIAAVLTPILPQIANNYMRVQPALKPA